MLGTAELYTPNSGNDALNTLGVTESISEHGLWMVQAVNTLAEQEMCGSIESESEHQIHSFDLLASCHLGNQNLAVLFEDVDITKTVLDELRSNELARIMP